MERQIAGSAAARFCEFQTFERVMTLIHGALSWKLNVRPNLVVGEFLPHMQAFYSVNHWLVYAILAAAIAFAGPVICQWLCKLICGKKPSYRSALISTLAGYGAVFAIGLILRLVVNAGLVDARSLNTAIRPTAFLLQLVCVAVAHVNLLRSDGERFMTGGKAFVVAFLQFVGSLVAAVVVFVILGGFERLLLHLRS